MGRSNAGSAYKINTEIKKNDRQKAGFVFAGKPPAKARICDRCGLERHASAFRISPTADNPRARVCAKCKNAEPK